MAGEDAIWREAARLRDTGEAFALVTITRTKGSTPRKAGAKMLVTRDRLVGTIGGGRIEHELVAEARAAIVARQPRTYRRHLTHELAMCCGGEMEAFIDVVTEREILILVGGGHVNAALCPVAAGLDYDVWVVDEEESFASAERFPTAERRLHDWEPAHWGVTDWSGVSVVVATRDHAVDEQVIQQLADAKITPRYLGCIGSRGKLGRFHKRLAARGIDSAWIERVRGPIGADVAAETPAEIAVAVAAELIHVRRRGAALPSSAWREDADSSGRGAA